MDESRQRYSPTPIALFLTALLVLVGLLFVKKQRWYSPHGERPETCEGLPRLVGPADEELRTSLQRQSPTIRVLLESSRSPLEAGGEGYPGVVQVVEAQDRYHRVCLLDLDTYVAHVVTGELPDGWDLEVKRAQAVAARSYALTEMAPDRHYDIRASALAQSFRAEQTDLGALEAAAATRGVVLMQDDRVVRAFYHAICGGTTASAREFWDMVRPRIPAVHCDHCAGSPLFRWNHETDLAELSRRMGAEVLDLWVDTTTSAGRATRVIVETDEGLHVLSGEEFRTAVGFTRLRSTWFVVEVGLGEGQQRPVRFMGRGSGHGVGMCQWGARSLSQDGFGWREILQYYYPGSTIDAMYGEYEEE